MQTTPSRFSRFLAHVNRDRFLLLLFLPGMAAIFVFSYGPLYGLQLAFKDYIFADGIWGSPWVGLSHFRIFTQPIFGRLIANTLIISSYRLLIGFPATILFALLINELASTRLNVTFKLTSVPSRSPYLLAHPRYFRGVLVVSTLSRN